MAKKSKNSGKIGNSLTKRNPLPNCAGDVVHPASASAGNKRQSLDLRGAVRGFALSVVNNQRHDFWARLTAYLLTVLSLLYHGILFLRFIVYQATAHKVRRSLIKVISIGNITVGGTGKTPLVELLVSHLLKHKYKTAVISRGYKRVTYAGQEIADEPAMLKNVFPDVPVIVNRDRTKALREAQQLYDCRYAVLDDAFQNLTVYPQLDIVCVDCRNPFGNGYLLPRGLLRVPFSYLQKADVFVLTHSNAASSNIESIISRLRRYNTKALIYKADHIPQFFYDLRHRTRTDISFIEGKQVGLLCAIARPENLEQSVNGLKAHISVRFFFEDHHFFSRKELNEIFTICREKKISIVITTAKDEPRLRAILGENWPTVEILVLKVKLKIKDDEEGFFKRLSALHTA